MKKLLLFLFTFSILINNSEAQIIREIKGIVLDKNNQDPLIGASISIKSSSGYKESTVSGLDGSFIIKNIPSGIYQVSISFVSYETLKTSLELKNDAVSIKKFFLEPRQNTLGQLTIKARIEPESDLSALKLEQRSNLVVNAVSARTIEVSPDITVANVTQRVSGVSIERSNNGEGQYAIIRGMEKRYTYTLIDGFKIPSPDNKNRYIPLDIFPSDIISRLEVYKSLSPAQEGDAIAGGINLVLKDAPEQFTIKFNIGTGLSQSASQNGFTTFGNRDIGLRSPRIKYGANYNASISDFSNNAQHFSKFITPIGSILGFSIGGRTLNNKLGLLFSASYQNVLKNTDSYLYSPDVDPVSNLPLLTDVERRTYSTQQIRSSLIGRIDYKFNPANKLILDASYINLVQDQYRFNSDTSLTLARTGFGQGRVTQSPRSIRNAKEIINISLGGDHKFSNVLGINWTGIYSKATAFENRYSLALITGVTLVNGVNVQQPVTIDALKGQDQVFSYNSDQDKTGSLNLIYKPKFFNKILELSFGGLYRNKTRLSTYDDYTLGLPQTNSTQNFDGNINHNTFIVSSLQGSAGDPLNYNFTENVASGYGQFRINTGRLQAIGGVRYEHTSESWSDALDASQLGKTGSIKYYDLLPSISIKYKLSDKQNLRASYYSAISRPNFYELVPHTSGDPDVDYQEVGNPYLKHATADNYDLRYEYFPKVLDQILAGVFYKKIKNPIEYALVNSGLGYVLEAGNFGTATNYGLELDFTKYIRNFGLKVNYAFTQSTITTPKRQDYKDANGNNTFREVDQSRPLQGQSRDIGNLSFLYKDSKIGLDAQLSAVYTGERINNVSAYYENDVWQKGYVNLDFSAEKRLFKDLYLYGKVTNLLNTPYQLFIKLPYPNAAPFGASGQPLLYQTAGQNTFVRKDIYQQYFILGVHYKL